MTTLDDIVGLFKTLTSRLTVFIDFVEEKDGNFMATDKWTVDDVLRHVTYWHMNYADNYKALAEGKQPPLLEGPYYQLNLQGVASLKKYSRNELIQKLHQAHNDLKKCILIEKVPQMQYKKEGKVLSTAQFLQIVEAHLRGHIKQVRKAH